MNTQIILKKAGVMALVLSGIITFPSSLNAEGLISRILFFQNRGDSNSQNERTMKDLLRKAIDNAVLELSQVNGFYHQSELKIDIPQQVKGIEKISKKLNAELFWHDFQLGLNRAAETAAPKAGVLMKEALEDLKFEKNPQEILDEEGSLTRYFRKKMEPRLQRDFRREIERSVSNQSALRSYLEFKGLYASIPFIKNTESVFDLEEKVSQKALEGIFLRIQEAEERLRSEKPESGKGT
ncbi:MAG TPA: DUF4197 domain-containing protein [Candidatus Omnitrophota bacterium]|nr:DUF4197 domain-containing protein [Candidatus Omnitrophota bacterium]